MSTNTILIIEDEEVLLSILRDKLEKEGFVVEVARDGEEGVEKVKEAIPDLILLDIVMPKMNGFDVIEALQKKVETQEIPIIVISNSGNEVEVERLEGMGIEDYLVKANFSPQEVMNKVKAYLAEHENSEDEQVSSSQENGEKSADNEAQDESDKADTKETLIVIEDERFLVDVMSSKFEEAGYEVVTAMNGKKGVELIREKEPKVILLDLLLPDMDGFEVLDEIKSDPKLQNIPVIVVSNYSAEEKRKMSLDKGAETYMVKASHAPEEFVEEVERVLGRSE